MPPLKKHQYYIQAYANSDKKEKDTPDNYGNGLKSEMKEQKPEVEIMKIEKHDDHVPIDNERMYNDIHASIHKTETQEHTGFESTSQNRDKGLQFIYQPLTPPSPKSSSTTAYASKLLQQLQIHRKNSSINSTHTSEIPHVGNNPLNQLAEISLAAAAAAHATSTQNTSDNENR